MSNWLIVIPARLHSQRLPKKPLAMLEGKPLVVRVYENLQPLREHAEILVATDSNEIQTLCNTENIPVIMTDPNHPSGTDRCHEVASKRDEKWILNVQGDEPFINPMDLLKLMTTLEQSSKPGMGTLVYPQSDSIRKQSPHVVKAITDAKGNALYFSREPIPHGSDQFLEHIGVYAFHRESLIRFHQAPASDLEQTERLEQLRALSIGIPLLVVHASQPSMGIDTYEELEQAAVWYRNQRNSPYPDRNSTTNRFLHEPS